MNDLKKYGEWGIVIGASMGIGAACARRLAEKGINVIVSARSIEKLNALKKEIEEKYKVQAIALPQDILADDAYKNINEATKDLDLGIAIFSAAYSYNGPFLKRSEEEYRKMAELNIFGAYRFAAYFADRFCKQKRGAIEFLGSLAGYYGAPGQAFYGGTKGFEGKFAEGLYSELKPYNVDVSVAYIGAVQTPGLVDMFGEEGCKKLGAADEQEVGNECVDVIGTAPAPVITKAMRSGANVMRKFMSYNKQVEVSGNANMKINCNGFANQFAEETGHVALRLGEKLADQE